MNETFNKVYEAIYSHYTAGCFYPGNVVSFDIKAVQATDAYKGLAKNIKARLDAMMESQQQGESVIVVAAVDVNPFLNKNYEPSTLTLAYSQGGGRWIEPLSLPGSIGEGIHVVESGVNLNNLIPNSCRINHDEFNSGGPKEVDLKDLEKNRFNTTVKSLF